MTSDEALMLEFQRGSREAFDELFGIICFTPRNRLYRNRRT